MRSLDPKTRELVLQGAKIGAFSCGFLAFCTGVGLCIAYRLPVPPIAVTELGILFGGMLGALSGYCWRSPAGRSMVIGLICGAVWGIPVACLAQHGLTRFCAWLASVVMSGVLGYQAGLAPKRDGASPWRLHR